MLPLAVNMGETGRRITENCGMLATVVSQAVDMLPLTGRTSSVPENSINRQGQHVKFIETTNFRPHVVIGGQAKLCNAQADVTQDTS